ncbi:hypothetical protein [Halobaculum marinum]|uniref:Uncharacterized protein n=1 Tax=Halobaculum marinum TaxID=3031996 RepID=A0ABD5X695_9EURY|nr:hypothetical protein [Halobaculum sp. DT55]
MVRSPRTQRVLLAVLAGCLAVSAAAFASTAGAQLAWQDRDAIDFSVDGYDLDDGDDPTLRIRVTASNPTAVETTVRVDSLVAFDRVAADGNELTVPRSATMSPRSVTLAPGESTTLVVVADVPADRLDRTREAIAAGRVTASGSFSVEIRDRRFSADV